MRNILLLLFILMLYGCPAYDPPTGVLTIHNYSDSAIYIYHTCEDSLQIMPRLSLFESWNANVVDAQGRKRDSIYSPNYRINAYSFGGINVLGTVKAPQLLCKDKSIRLFIISESTMRTKNWEEICKNQLYVKKIILTEEQLSKEGWQYTHYP